MCFFVGICKANNFIDNDVISHPYFGTGMVVDDLKKFRGWKTGRITFNFGNMRRLVAGDSDTLIVGFDADRLLSVEA